MQNFKEETPSNINNLIKISRDKSNYQNRLLAVEELGQWKCRQSIDKLWKLMISDKVYSVQKNAFLKLQAFGEKVKLPKKKKGHLVKDINKKLINIHKKFNSSDYNLDDFKKKFKETYPEIFDIYNYEKKEGFDKWIKSVIQHSPNKKLKNKYKITIEFRNPKKLKNQIFKDKIPYVGFVNELDEITITTHSIFIKAERSAIYHPKNILNNDTNTIHIQIIKSLIIYYLEVKKFIEIKSIHITREKTKILGEYKIPNLDIKLEQVLSNKYQFKNSCQISPNTLKEIFKSNPKSLALFNASSYLLKALSTGESSSKFEKLWKSFNSIYRYIGQTKNENECHVKLRQFLLDNQMNFVNSKIKASKITKEILREKLRFRDLILNDYETKNLTVSFIAFIYRYTDTRILKIIQETLGNREEFLKDIHSINKVESKFNKFDEIKHLYQNAKGQPQEYIYNEVVNYLQTHITNNTIVDMEIIAFICIKYGYYVRNKIFHAEKHDLSFRFIKNNQIEELDWLNEVLTLLVVELIENIDKW